MVMVNNSGGSDKGIGMVVVRRKGMMWQHLNWHYLIWKVAGCGASIDNMLTLFPTLRNAVMVQSARALDS